jgi:hypothetical protein
MQQLYQVATTLSNKLHALGFVSHLAHQVTRIRKVCFNSGLTIPVDLLSVPTVETMAQFLHFLSRALCEETSVLYWEGREGAGYIVSAVTALCPEDVWISVEGQLIFQGDRRSVMVSIKSEVPTQFSLETWVVTCRPGRLDIGVDFFRILVVLLVVCCTVATVCLLLFGVSLRTEKFGDGDVLERVWSERRVGDGRCVGGLRRLGFSIA